MSKKKKYVNWARYENGRENELRKLIGILKESIYSLDPPYTMKWREGGVGRPPHNPKAITLLMILQKYMRLSEREFISLIKSMDWILDEIGLKYAPSRHSLYLARKKVSIQYMRKLNEKIIENLGNSKTFSVDATGFKNSRQDPSWTIKKKRKNYTKFHLISDTETKSLKSFTITPGNNHESPYLEELLDPIDMIHNLLADSGYLSRKNCDLVDKKGAPQ